MHKHRTISAILFILALAPGYSAVAQLPAPQFSAEAAAVYSAADMSSAIVNRTVLDPTSVEAAEIGMRDLTLSKAAVAETDLKYVGIYSLPSGAWHSYRLTVARCLAFNLNHGRLPVAGWEMYPELATTAGLEQFILMSPSERLIRYSAGIDFATGRFYGPFDNPDWRAGGLYLRLLTETREPLSPRGGWLDLSNLVRPGSSACEYKVFGSEADSVIATGFSAFSDQPQPDMPPMPKV